MCAFMRIISLVSFVYTIDTSLFRNKISRKFLAKTLLLSVYGFTLSSDDNYYLLQIGSYTG